MGDDAFANVAQISKASHQADRDILYIDSIPEKSFS